MAWVSKQLCFFAWIILSWQCKFVPIRPPPLHPAHFKDLFSLYVLFSQYRSCDITLENCFFQISSHLRAYLRIIYEKQILFS